jgi:hypothetical protein
MTTEFINKSGLEFVDLNSEQSRTYDFGDGNTVTVDEPLKLNVSKSGGHRIFDAFGISHYIPGGWVHLSWVVKPGKPHFDF